MRKKLAGIHLLAPLNESEVTDLSRNLDRELIINTTPVTDAVIDTHETTNYIVTFEYDTTLDGGANQIRRSIPTLELLGNPDTDVSGTHWIQLEDKEYHYIDSYVNAQTAFEQLDAALSDTSHLKHIIDANGSGSIVSSNDGFTSSSVIDSSDYSIVLGYEHTLSGSPYSVIMGGYHSVINTSGLSKYNSILCSEFGNISQYAYLASIYGGSYNTIQSNVIYSFIMNGYNNLLNGYVYESSIINGHGNKIEYIGNINNDNVFNSILINTVDCYIIDSNFSSGITSDQILIKESTYSSSLSSSHIEIHKSLYSNASFSTFTSILKSTNSNIITSTNVLTDLNIYNCNMSTIDSSSSSYIYNNNMASIVSSLDSTLGYYILPESQISISKTPSSLTMDDVSMYSIGQLVTLMGAEFTSVTNIYRIRDIDTSNRLLYFVNDNNSNHITFSSNYSGIQITVKVLNIQYENANVLSNTNDTIVLDDVINTNITYAIIGNTTTKYTIIPASGTSIYTNTIKLKLYGSDDVISDLVTNSLSELVIYTYSDQSYGTTNCIIASNLSHSWYGSNDIILGSYNSSIDTGAYNSIITSENSYIKSGGHGSIISSNTSTISNFSNSIISGGSNHYINSSGNATLIGGHDNKIAITTDCSILAGYSNYITSSSNSVILGGYHNYIIGSGNNAILGGYNNNVSTYTNVVMIGCTDTIAWRSNALIAKSFSLVDGTFELMDDTPQQGNVLIVDYVLSGNVAKVKWGSASGGSINMVPIEYNMSGNVSLDDIENTTGSVVYSINNTASSDIVLTIAQSSRHEYGSVIYIIQSADSNIFKINCGGGSGTVIQTKGECGVLMFMKDSENNWCMPNSAYNFKESS